MERVRIGDEKSQPRRTHFVLELELHVELDRVATETDVVRWIAVVGEGKLESKLSRVKRDRAGDVARAENRLGHPEHGRSFHARSCCESGRGMS
jgi:hypothetical protein